MSLMARLVLGSAETSLELRAGYTALGMVVLRVVDCPPCSVLVSGTDNEVMPAVIAGETGYHWYLSPATKPYNQNIRISETDIGRANLLFEGMK